jgi:hypothetical protein
MRQTIRSLLVADGGLTDVIPTERWFQAGAVLDVPPLPFAILRWLSPVRGDAKGAFAHQFQVAIYDERGDYTRIDAILGGQHKTGGVWPILNGIADVSGPDGRISQADYLGDSGDQEDIDYRANLKFSSWQIVGRSF